jgi:hypothetical protein
MTPKESFPEDLISVAPISKDRKVHLPQLIVEKYMHMKPGDKYNIVSVTTLDSTKIRLYKSKSQVIYDNKIPKDFNIKLSEGLMKLLYVEVGDIIGFEYDPSYSALIMRRATNEIK